MPKRKSTSDVAAAATQGDSKRTNAEHDPGLISPILGGASSILPSLEQGNGPPIPHPANAIDYSPGFGAKLGTKIVEILVGQQMESFRVHTTLIRSRVPYFAKQIPNNFADNKDTKVVLAFGDANTFSHFLEWLYSDRLEPFVPSSKVPIKEWLTGKVKLYCFAEVLGLNSLANLVMTTLVTNYTHYNQHPTLNDVLYAHKNSKQGSPIQNFMSMYLHHAIEMSARDSKHHDEYTPAKVAAALASNPELCHNLVLAMRDHSIACMAGTLNYQTGPRNPITFLGSRWLHAQPVGIACDLPLRFLQ